MERTNNSNLQELVLNDKIIGWRCSECGQDITEQNYKDKNFTLWFSVDDYDWEVMGDGATKLSLRIHAITHEKTSFYDCPDVDTCSGCNKKFLAEKVKTAIGESDIYYCEPCFNEKYGEYLKERSKKKPLTDEQKETMKIVKKALTEHLTSKLSQWRGRL